MKAAPAAQPLLTFGQCLKQILNTRRLSASALSRMMEQKSRNSMFRILDDTGGPAVQAAFFENLKESDCLRLTQEEERALETALEVSRVGPTGYMTNLAMHRLLGDVDVQTSPDVPFRVDRSLDGSVTTLREAMHRLVREQKRVQFTITGCCYRAVFDRIIEAFGKSDCEFSIKHYMYTGGDEIISCVSAIQPVLYLPSYTGYCIGENMFNAQREQVYRCNTITAHCEDAQGQKRTYMVMMIDPRRMISIGLADERNIGILERMMREDQPKMHPIKSSFALNHTPEDYLAYTESFWRLERGRGVYDIKLDVPINFISPEVLVGPARDGFVEKGFAQGEALDAMIRRFYDVHQKRFDNYFQKRRPTHTIFSKQAMAQFAQTGKQSDHFFAMRPLTKEERVAVLTHLKTQNEQNPYFFVYFFKPEYHQPRTEICLYEGKGTMLTKADTDYDFSGVHTEALITQPEFSRKYKEFFLKDLLESKVLSPRETQEAFDELIEIAKQ